MTRRLDAQIELLTEEKECLARKAPRPAAVGRENGHVHHESNHTIQSEESTQQLNKHISRLRDELQTTIKEREVTNSITVSIRERSQGTCLARERGGARETTLHFGSKEGDGSKLGVRVLLTLPY